MKPALFKGDDVGSETERQKLVTAIYGQHRSQDSREETGFKINQN